MTISRSLALCAIVAVAGVASAQKVTLRFKPAVGKTYVYSTTTDSSGSGAMAAMMKMTQTSTSTLKILSKAGDMTKISLATSNIKMKVPDGSPMKAQLASIEKGAASTITMSINSLGAASGITVKGGGATMQMSGDMMSSVGPASAMPKEAVGPGSTWKSTLDLSKMFGKGMPAGMKLSGGKIPLNLKLIKFVDKGGKKLAQIDTTGKGNLSMSGQGSLTMTISFKTTALIDVATGVTIETVSSSENKMNFGGQAMTQTSKTTMKLK